MMRQSIRLYNWSDLHLERSKYSYEILFQELDLDEDFINILTLTGDISRPHHPEYEILFENMSGAFNHVIYVAGNHEYQGTTYTMKEIKSFIRQMLKPFKNIHFLDNSTIEIEDLVFIGTTLWSHIPKVYENDIQNVISDYKSINWNKNEPFKVCHTNGLNYEARIFLRKALEYNKNKRCIVLTHHSPLFSVPEDNFYTANPKHVGNYISYSYNNNLIDFFQDPIILWIFGHTHYRNLLKVNNVILWTHQLGDGELNERYDVNDYIEL